MFTNYCLLNPLNTIFNFSSKKNTLKRKSPTASENNFCPRKQKIYMPLGYPRQVQDYSEKNNESSTGYKVSNRTNHSLILSKKTSYQYDFINQFEDEDSGTENDQNALNHDDINNNACTNRKENHIKDCEYLVTQHYSRMSKYTLPKVRIRTRNDFNIRTYQTFTQHCRQVFDDSERQAHNPNLIEDIWNNMSLCRKFQYYWLVANCTQLSKNSFENFLTFYKKLPKYHQKPINLQKLLHIWKRMSYDEKLPFIFETFLVHISASSKLFKEHNIKLFFDEGKRKIKS